MFRVSSIVGGAPTGVKSHGAKYSVDVLVAEAVRQGAVVVRRDRAVVDRQVVVDAPVVVDTSDAKFLAVSSMVGRCVDDYGPGVFGVLADRSFGMGDNGLVLCGIFSRPSPCEVVLYLRDVVITTSGIGRRPGPGGRRRVITRLSRRARQRMSFEFNNVDGPDHMITLTWPSEFPGDGREVKRCLKNINRRLVRCGWRGVWILEFQGRGAPHFHLFVSCGRVLRSCERQAFKAWLSRAWFDIVGSGDDKHLRAGTRFERLRSGNLSGYARKYGEKLIQKDVPAEFYNVGRFWGRVGRPSVPSVVVYSGNFQGMVRLVRALRKCRDSARRVWRRRDGLRYRRVRVPGRYSHVLWSCGQALVYLVRALVGRHGLPGVDNAFVPECV